MFRSKYLILAVLALATSSIGQTFADVNTFAHIASNSITPLLIIGETTLSLHSRSQAEQVAKTMAVTTLATELLKFTVREKRPLSNSRTSFPSGHTASAFAMATLVAHAKPKLAIPAYATASLIGWSRVELDQHRWRDVIAGAALGYFTAKHFTRSNITVSPAGIGYTRKW